MRVCWCCVYNCSNSLLFSVLVDFYSCQCRCRISSLLCAYKCSNLHSILKFRTSFSWLSRSNNWVNSYYSWLYPESQRGKICLNLPLFELLSTITFCNSVTCTPSKIKSPSYFLPVPWWFRWRWRSVVIPLNFSRWRTRALLFKFWRSPFPSISSCSRAALQRRDTVRSSYTAVSNTMPPPRQLKTRQKPQPMKPYLADDADIFEVDPNRGVPQRRDAVVNDASDTSRGLSGWLSDLLERTIFW